MAWYNPAWQYRKKLTIDFTKVSGNLTDFPVLVTPSTDSDIVNNSLASGDDLVFTDSDGTTVLPSEHGNHSIIDDNGCWTWFNDPRAIRAGNKTFIGWINASSSGGDVKIQSYDHTNGVTVTFVLKDNLQGDDHDNPAILRLSNGRLVAFYSFHNGASYYRLSDNADDVSAWGAEQTIVAANAAYVNPVLLADGTIYLFHRLSLQAQYFLTTTEANILAGTPAWSADTVFMLNGTQRPYFKYCPDPDGTDIHMFYSSGQPSEVALNHLYYLRFESDTGDFKKTDGTVVGNVSSLPLATTVGDQVYNATPSGFGGWTWDIALDSNGYPVLVGLVATAIEASITATTGHSYWYWRWDGDSWVSNLITLAGGGIYAGEIYYSGGICLDHENPNIIYLSRNNTTGNLYTLEQWTTADLGVSWTTRTISNIGNNFRPFVPLGHSGDELSLLWWSTYAGSNIKYTLYTDYYTNLRGLRIPSTTGLSECYVKVPSVSASVNTDFYVYFGNAAAPLRGVIGGAWDTNFLSVGHLNNASPHLLSVQNAVTGVSGVKLDTVPTEGAGQVVKAQSFGGSGHINNHLVPMAGLAAITVEGWVKTAAAVGYIVSNFKNVPAPTGSFMARFTASTFQGFIIKADGTNVGGAFSELTATNVWSHFALIYDKDNGGLKAYLNGVLSATSYAGTTALHATASTDYYYGWSPHDVGNKLIGLVDEVRISNIARSPAWLITSYNNQNDSAAFLTAGSLEVPTSFVGSLRHFIGIALGL